LILVPQPPAAKAALVANFSVSLVGQGRNAIYMQLEPESPKSQSAVIQSGFGT